MNELYNIQFSSVYTLFFAVILALLGEWINSKVSVFRKYCISGAVVGGLLFAALALALRLTGVVGFTFDNSYQGFFMDLFFTASGFGASMVVLKKGGKVVIVFLILASLLAFLQNVLSVSLGTMLGLEPMIALMTGSIPMTGGHGYAASFAPPDYPGALSVAIAAATFGLVSGSLLGGPLANSLIQKKHLLDRVADGSMDTESPEKSAAMVSVGEIPKSFFLIFVALGVGMIMQSVFNYFFPSVVLSSHVMGMCGGAVMRVALDAKKADVPEVEIETIGDVVLTVFVSMAIYTMKLWELIDMALPIMVVLLAQVLLMYLFARYLTFNLTGKNYDAAVICAGHVGFGLGAVPVAMANMNALRVKYRYSKLAFLVVPVIGGLFCNFTNAAIITMWLNWCR